MLIMVTLWFNAGVPVVDGSNAMIDCADCPCTTPMTPCGCCSGATPLQWKTEFIGGFTGGCAVFNDARWTLTQVSGNPCVWIGGPDVDHVVVLTIGCGGGSAGSIQLSFGTVEGDSAIYDFLFTTDTIDCMASYTLAQDGTTCTGPASIDVVHA